MPEECLDIGPLSILCVHVNPFSDELPGFLLRESPDNPALTYFEIRLARSLHNPPNAAGGEDRE